MWPADQAVLMTSTNPKGSPNFQSCNVAEALLSGNKDFQKGVSYLDGIEMSFECAGMCDGSRFYAFSDVGM